MNAPISQEHLEIASAATQQQTFHEYLRIVGRHKLNILLLTLLFAVLGGLSAAMEVPLYRASSLLLIERDVQRAVNVRDDYSSVAANYEYYTTQFEVLKTFPLAERVVKDVGADAILKAHQKEANLSLNKLLPWRKPVVVQRTPDQAFADAISIVRSALRIEPLRNSQIVRIHFQTPDPAMAAKLSNALAEAYIENTLESRLQMVRKATSWLSERIESLQQALLDSKRRLQEYAEREGIVRTAGADDFLNQSITMLNSQLANAYGERVSREALYNQIVSAQRANTPLENIPGLKANSSTLLLQDRYASVRQRLSDLSNRYGAEHPTLIAAKNEEQGVLREYRNALSTAAEGIKKEYESALLVERNLRGQIEAARTGMQLNNRKSIEYDKLAQEVSANQQILDTFSAQVRQTDEVGKFETSNARVVELATPMNNPIYPNVPRSVISALLLGLALSVLLAFVLEHLDNTIKTAEDVERRLALPVLGLVPLIKNVKQPSDALRYFSNNGKTAFSEAVRTVRTGLLLSTLDKTHRRVLVTSSLPNEGKTTLSLNLAQAMSQMNKVLLIDADIRRPAVARVFGDKKPQLGLSQFISGEAKISECVNQLEGTNTYIMTAGVVPPNPLELLSSAKFSEALDNLGKVFDYIVIDCAPSLAVSDALVLSRLVDGVIYVVRCDSTPYQAAQAGVKRLRRVDAPILGVVLNRVGERSHGYGYGRYGYYAEGYYQHEGYYGQDAKPVKPGKS
jgi:polysaccharide biosynthesis transport protein